MPGTKHPLVSADRSNTSSDLIGQSLKRQSMVGFAQCTGNGNGRASLFLSFQKGVNGFGESSIEQMLVTVIRNSTGFSTRQSRGQMKSMDRVQKEQGPNSFVKVLALSSKRIQCTAFGIQLIGSKRQTDLIQRQVTLLRVTGCNDVYKLTHGWRFTLLKNEKEISERQAG